MEFSQRPGKPQTECRAVNHRNSTQKRLLTTCPATRRLFPKKGKGPKGQAFGATHVPPSPALQAEVARRRRGYGMYQQTRAFTGAAMSVRSDHVHTAWSSLCPHLSSRHLRAPKEGVWATQTLSGAWRPGPGVASPMGGQWPGPQLPHGSGGFAATACAPIEVTASMTSTWHPAL